MQGISTDGLVRGEVSTAYFKNSITDKNIEFKHVVTDYEEGVMFGWSGHLFADVKDHHIYSLEALPNGNTMLREEDGLHSEHNLESAFLNLLGDRGLIKTYETFNQELKDRVESILLKNKLL